MELDVLLNAIKPRSVSGPVKTDIGGIRHDSRAVEPGDLFAALRGLKVDGHQYVDTAMEKGAAAVLAEAPVPEDFRAPWVQVENSRAAMAALSDAFYGKPSEELVVAGITGTNGKTTTAFLLNHLLKCAWRRGGLIGTVQYEVADEIRPAPLTTPESVEVHALLAEMRDAGCRSAVMEVSSQGLVQHRVGGVRFDVGVYTNLSQDHLDYHGTMEQYFAAKRMLFEQIEARQGVAKHGIVPAMVVNRDDRFGERLAKAEFPNTRLLTYGMGAHCDFRAINPVSDFSGTRYQVEANKRSFLLTLPLIGRFNVYNSLAALAASYALGLNLRESVRNLAECPQVPGRLESVGQHLNFRVYVDYAHTPDALEKVLETVRELKPKRLITVFGCGGDRDKAKRPLMGAAVQRVSDVAIVTSDNPRTEDPAAIIRDIEAGMTKGRYAAIVDRREAIYEAITRAGEKDIVLIAGKGHETYQEIGGVRHDFDDRKVALNAIASRPPSF